MRILSSVHPTREQLKLIGDVHTGFQIIRGAAGTGKTTTSLLRLRELATVRLNRRRHHGHEAPVRVLVLTFNRTLAGYITELARNSTPNEDSLNLEVTTFGRWAKSLIDNVKIATDNQILKLLQPYLQQLSKNASYDFLADEIGYILGRFLPDELSTYLTATRDGRGASPRVNREMRKTILSDIIPSYTAKKAHHGLIDWNDLAILAAEAQPDLHYDVVVIDEAQDFSANQVRAVLNHLHDLHSTTFVLDATQRIYPRYFKWSEVGIKAGSENIRTLKENHRNTAAIAAFARVLVNDLPIDDDGTIPDFSACHRAGEKPLVITGKFSNQLRFMLDRLAATIHKGDESIALLHPRGGGWFAETRRVLQNQRIPFCELTRRPEWPTGPEVVALSTIHSAKGLEFDHVLIPGLNQQVTPHGPENHDTDRERLRRMLAMAIGRARENVMIGYKPGEESSLIELLDPSTYELVKV